MISDLTGFSGGLRPKPPAMPAAAAIRPDAESAHGLARKESNPSQVALGFAPVPGLGGSLDLYDTEGKRRAVQNHPIPESSTRQPDFPYLKPLAEKTMGRNFNTLI